MDKLIDEKVIDILTKRGVTDFYEAISLLLTMGYKEGLAFYTALFHFDVNQTDNEDCIYIYGTIDESRKICLHRRKPLSNNLIDYLKFCRKNAYTPRGYDSIIDKVFEITVKDPSIYDYILKKIALMGIELMELYEEDEEDDEEYYDLGEPGEVIHFDEEEVRAVDILANNRRDDGGYNSGRDENGGRIWG